MFERDLINVITYSSESI